ncbi:hypothetical protein ACFL0X_02495 [Nanoarchaeota archaeon]
MKKSLIVIGFVLILSLSLVSASWFSDFIEDIFGKKVFEDLNCQNSQPLTILLQ